MLGASGLNFCNETVSKSIINGTKRTNVVAKHTCLLLAALAAGCAGAPEAPSVIEKNDAIDDYIQVAELKEIDAIRSFDQLSHKVVTEKYIIISDRRNNYLAAFARSCKELNKHEITPDIRHESNTLRARFDTIRGCQIRSLYEIGAGQAQELMKLGETQCE